MSTAASSRTPRTRSFRAASAGTGTGPLLDDATHGDVDAVRRPLGWMLLLSTVANFAAVALLGASFGWPAVLDEPASVALTAFAQNQTAVVAGFYLFTLLSVLLVPISLGLHRLTSARSPLLAPTVTAFGVLAGAFQTLGWIRWPFAVPDLARTYLDPATPAAARDAAASSYDLVNHYAGGAVGEHLGWLFQAGWGLGIAVLIARTGVASRALAVTGAVLTVAWAVPFLLGEAVPALAQGLVATGGFTAYSLWFVWTAALGVALLRRRGQRTR